MVPCQLLAYALFALAQRRHPAPHRRHMLAPRPVHARHERCIDLPAARRSPLILIEAPSSAYHRGMLSLENNHSHEEETSCASTPNSTNFIVVSTCTLVPCTSVF